ncbi:phosphate ABC transporter substrate-binding protein PstS [Micromonospora sp. NPDC093277]|uniref:phosphate ABC transporter substrate-binding protein PstS n=1 Tax=Micromonospora sp. NPDC093277 TaxID=3364291 RepID=UPI0037FE14F8
MTASMFRPRRLAAVRAVLALLLVALSGIAGAFPSATPARAAETPIYGSGSTWSANAISQWIADVATNGLRVSFTANGSSAGRLDFHVKQSDFGVSEIPYQGRDPVTGTIDDTNRPYAYMPIVAGGTSFMYHLTVGGQLYRDLRLSGDTITKIFTGRITNWSDPAITRDNNGKQLPNKRIVPVVRSDGSGTTAQFTTWMAKEHASLWCPFFAEKISRTNRCGLTSYYPQFNNSVAQSGSVQMAGYISASYGEGTIGYVEYSYARNKNYPVAKVRNAAGYYVLPTQYNVAVALTKARINTNRDPKVYLTQVLDDVYRYQDPRTYPLSSYSYMILPTSLDGRLTEEKGRSLSLFGQYFLCQGQQKAGPLGYSPLPLNLVKAGFEQLQRVPGAVRSSLRPEGCQNPTFDAANPNSNRLARIAPQPPGCDRDGQGPCSGGGAGNGGGGNGGGANGGGSGGRNGDLAAGQPGGTVSPGASVGPGPTTPGEDVRIDPITGEVLGDAEGAGDGATGGGGGSGVVELAASQGSIQALSVLVVVQLGLVLLLPVLVARAVRRRDPDPRDR